MSRFRYQALQRDGDLVKGEIESPHRDQAVEQLQRTGLMVVQIVPSGSNHLLRLVRRRSPISEAKVLNFTQQLATLLDAGQPLEAALALQLRQQKSGPFSALLKRLLEQVKSGSALSAAMATEGAIFNNFYLSLVRAGEAAGMLSDALRDLAQSLERAGSLRSELISALIYPTFLVIGVLGSLALLMAYVVPQFVPIFDDLNVPLPWITQVILAVGEACASWGGLLLAAILVIAIGFSRYVQQPAVRLVLDIRMLRLPWLGPVLQGSEVARLALTIGTLLERKVGLLASLDIGAQVASNSAIAVALQAARDGVRDGHALSTTFERTQAIPELAVQMIRVGEQSGELPKMLLKLADIYDKQTQTTLKRLMTALVPTLTLIMTALVAVIMLAIMLPLMSLTSNI